jgi:hypothetical protein
MTAEGDKSEAAGALELDDLQRAVLLPQVEAFIDATPESAGHDTYVALRESVARGTVGADLLARLGVIVEVALASGRVRKLFGPAAEHSLTSLFQKTPRGQEIASAIAAVNAALAKLRGGAVESATVSLRAPGAYALTLRTAGCQLVLRFEQAGVRVESIEVDLG